jgi:Transposase DDE domain
VARRILAPHPNGTKDHPWDVDEDFQTVTQKVNEAINIGEKFVALKVKRGEHRPPECDHGVWTFAGADRKRGATKWRCPTGECKPASTWVVASHLHPLIPRETKRWKAGYRKRAAVEREFGRLKTSWRLKPLRVRGLDRVRLHADLTVLTKLACAPYSPSPQ